MDKKFSLEDFGVKRYEGTLKNGLRVVFIEKEFAPIYARLMIRAGAIFDPADKKGLAHFTEHCIVSGSESHSKEMFALLIESIGGYWNAATSRDAMQIECEVALREHLSNMEEFFEHAIGGLHITDESVAKEREIIISEIERARSKASYEGGVYLNTRLANGTKWDALTLGTIESVSAISKEDIALFFEKFCCVENMVLVIAGACSWSDIEETFETLTLHHGELHELPDDPEPVSANVPVIFEQNIPQTDIFIGFKTPRSETRHVYLFNFALKYLHAGTTSRFFNKLRTEMNLAYDVSYESFGFNTFSYAGTGIGVPTNKVIETIKATLICYKELLDKGISQSEIDARINSLWFSAKRNMERSVDWVDTNDYDELYPKTNPLAGPYPDVFNYRKTYGAQEIHDVLRKYIDMKNIYVFMRGKDVSKIDLQKILTEVL